MGPLFLSPGTQTQESLSVQSFGQRLAVPAFPTADRTASDTEPPPELLLAESESKSAVPDAVAQADRATVGQVWRRASPPSGPIEIAQGRRGDQQVRGGHACRSFESIEDRRHAAGQPWAGRPASRFPAADATFVQADLSGKVSLAQTEPAADCPQTPGE